MIVTRSTEDSIVRLAEALVCVGEAIDSQQAQLTKLAGENEIILGLLAKLNNRLGVIDEEIRRESEWESEGGR